jgi:transposase, IS30 family
MLYKHLTIEEREDIQQGLWRQEPLREIARKLGRSSSSVSREISRNRDSLGRRTYLPRSAHERAFEKRKSRGRTDRLKSDAIRAYVVVHLKLRWSPEQVAHRMRKDLPGCRISHEAIYQFIYHQIHRRGWGYLKPGCEDLRAYLRRRKKRRTHQGMRRCRKMSVERGVSIDLRPKVVALRARVGDWESDTVESCDHKPGINTLVERKTGLVLITRLKDKTSEATVSAIEGRVRELPDVLKRTATFDNGPENQKWLELEKRTGLKCFFAHPYRSGERGTNENTNGLIRGWFPKRTDFASVSQEQIQEVENLLNARPRKRLDWATPSEVFLKESSKINISINMPSVALAG